MLINFSHRMHYNLHALLHNISSLESFSSYNKLTNDYLYGSTLQINIYFRNILQKVGFYDQT